MPHFRNFAVYNVRGVNLEPEKRENLGSFYDGLSHKNGTDQTEEPLVEISKWDVNTFTGTTWKEMSFNLTQFVTRIGQYEVTFSDGDAPKASGLDFQDWDLQMYGGKAGNSIEFLSNRSTFRITRSQQTLDEFQTVFSVKIRSSSVRTSGKVSIKRLIY